MKKRFLTKYLYKDYSLSKGETQILDYHRRAADHLFQGLGQPDCDGAKQQGGRASGISGFLPVGTRLRRQGGQSRDEYRRKYLLRAGRRGNGEDALRAFRQSLAEAAEHNYQPQRQVHIHQHADGFAHPAIEDFLSGYNVFSHLAMSCCNSHSK